MKQKDFKRGKFKIIWIIGVLLLASFFVYFYFSSQFKTGDFVYKKNDNLIGEIKGISFFGNYLIQWQNGNLSEESSSSIVKLKDLSDLDIENILNQSDDQYYDYYPGEIAGGIVSGDFNTSNFSDLDTIPDFGSSGFGLKTKKGDCMPHFMCGGWGKCQITYDLENLLKDEFVSGIQYRYCKDSFDCMSDFIDFRNCETKMFIDIQKVKIGDIEYLEIYDKENDLISRLDLVDEAVIQLNIQIPVDGAEYYPYCFDGIKNYDEDEVDCVYDKGNCPVCFEESSSIGYDWRIIILFVLAILCLLFIIWYLVLRRRVKGR